MPRRRVVLLDVYETAISTDFERVLQGLASTAGLTLTEWMAGARAHVDDVTRGLMTLEEAFTRTVEETGWTSQRISDLVQADVDLLTDHSTVYPDVWPFLDNARQQGLKVVLISNCAQNTRPLLRALGVLGAVDDAVLSCEVRSAKPDPGIYHAALQLAGAAPDEALLVDDQPAYCEGARTLGIHAILIDRTGRRPGSVSNLLDVLHDLHSDHSVQRTHRPTSS